MGKNFSSEIMTRFAIGKKMPKTLELVRSRFQIEETNISAIVEILCDKILDLNNTINIIGETNEKFTLPDLLKQISYLSQRTTKKERILFFIFEETKRNRTVFLDSITKCLLLKNPCSRQEALNIVEDLEKKELIIRIRGCPACETPFINLAIQCDKCGHQLILQPVSFKDKRSRPRFAIEITKKGRLYLKETMRAFFNINSFFAVWRNFAAAYG